MTAQDRAHRLLRYTVGGLCETAHAYLDPGVHSRTCERITAAFEASEAETSRLREALERIAFAPGQAPKCPWCWEHVPCREDCPFLISKDALRPTPEVGDVWRGTAQHTHQDERTLTGRVEDGAFQTDRKTTIDAISFTNGDFVFVRRGIW